eukprot:scaffold80198_cov73-Phaeocystis_antarctica.AAC.5
MVPHGIHLSTFYSHDPGEVHDARERAGDGRARGASLHHGAGAGAAGGRGQRGSAPRGARAAARGRRDTCARQGESGIRHTAFRHTVGHEELAAGCATRSARQGREHQGARAAAGCGARVAARIGVTEALAPRWHATRLQVV